MIRKETHWRRALKPLAASLMACALLAPSMAAAEKRPIPILNNGRGIAPKVTAPTVRDGNTNPKGNSVRLEGKMTFSGKQGLTIDGMPVRISPQTSFFPQPAGDRMPDPSRFRGKHVTVFGTKRGGVVEATLLLIDSGAFSMNPMDSLKEWMVPSESNENLGHFRKNAPE